MRVAALYDIHGNLPALEAVLQEVAQAGVDQIVVGGDVFSGPMPQETFDCLLHLSLPVHFIRGNADREVLEQIIGSNIDALPEEIREVTQWAAQQLKPQHVQSIASWLATLRLDISGLGEVLFCHATPRSDTELFTRLTPEERLLPLFTRIKIPRAVGHLWSYPYAV
ncbi:MAG: metallophosphoesterase family protein [Caldilineaceae bacterium]